MNSIDFRELYSSIYHTDIFGFSLKARKKHSDVIPDADADVVLETAEIHLGALSKGVHTVNLTIKNYRQHLVEIRHVHFNGTSSSAFLGADELFTPKLIPPGETVTVGITLNTSGLPDGYHTASLSFPLQNLQTLRADVYWAVDSPLSETRAEFTSHNIPGGDVIFNMTHLIMLPNNIIPEIRIDEDQPNTIISWDPRSSANKPPSINLFSEKGDQYFFQASGALSFIGNLPAPGYYYCTDHKGNMVDTYSGKSFHFLNGKLFEYYFPVYALYRIIITDCTSQVKLISRGDGVDTEFIQQGNTTVIMVRFIKKPVTQSISRLYIGIEDHLVNFGFTFDVVRKGVRIGESFKCNLIGTDQDEYFYICTFNAKGYGNVDCHFLDSEVHADLPVIVSNPDYKKYSFSFSLPKAYADSKYVHGTLFNILVRPEAAATKLVTFPLPVLHDTTFERVRLASIFLTAGERQVHPIELNSQIDPTEAECFIESTDQFIVTSKSSGWEVYHSNILFISVLIRNRTIYCRFSPNVGQGLRSFDFSMHIKHFVQGTDYETVLDISGSIEVASLVLESVEPIESLHNKAYELFIKNKGKTTAFITSIQIPPKSGVVQIVNNPNMPLSIVSGEVIAIQLSVSNQIINNGNSEMIVINYNNMESLTIPISVITHQIGYNHE